MEEFFRATSSNLGPAQEHLNMWQRLDAQSNGEEAEWFTMAAQLRYPDNEAELSAAFSLRATDNLAVNGA